MCYLNKEGRIFNLMIMSDRYPVFNRKPAVAGQFYPANPDVLQQELSELFAVAAPKECKHVRAIISPHAGYVFSGEIAASAFNQIDNSVDYKRIFLIASSHQAYFEGASVYCDGDFLMPYGKEEVDTEFGKILDLMTGEQLNVTSATTSITIPAHRFLYYIDRQTTFPSVGIENVENYVEVKAYYDNSTSDIRVLTDKDVKNIKVYSINGILVKNVDNNVFVNASGLSSGCYLVRVQLGDGTLNTFKVLKF